MKRRRLRLATIDRAIEEIDRLHSCGYERVGTWDVARTCDHLALTMRMSLDGCPPDMRPFWPLRILGPTVVKWTVLGLGWMARGAPVPHSSLSIADPRAEQIAVSHCIATFREVRDFDGEYHPNPVMGKLSPNHWRRFHLVHAAHHLRFLLPKS
jgi:Protein of unknown function (DUF1569)